VSPDRRFPRVGHSRLLHPPIKLDLLFISNGEAGVYVAQATQPFSATGSEASQQLTMLGRLRFGNLQSVNHVAYRSGHLFIAAGLGGLKIVKVNGAEGL
jgi:hypothetical protein